MKKIYFLVFALCYFGVGTAQIINFPDANFKAKLLSASSSNHVASTSSPSQDGYVFPYSKIDVNNNNEIELSEAMQIKYLNVSSSNISSLIGIEFFTNLMLLYCNNNQITILNIAQNPSLIRLNCSQNQISNLNVTQFFSLYSLVCSNNLLTNLNILQNPNLAYLNCSNNQISVLNVSSNLYLYTLYAQNNLLTNLNILQNVNLVYFNCSFNQITSLNVSQNIYMDTLYCVDNQISSLDISQLPDLTYFSCEGNQISSLNTSLNTFLNSLDCSNNQINNLNLTQNILLEKLNCSQNQITSLNLTDNQLLINLNCGNNPLQTLFIKNNSTEIDIVNNLNLPTFTFSNLPTLRYICADDFQIQAIQNQIAIYGYTNCNVNSYCSFTPGGNFYTIQGTQKFDENNNGCDALDNSLVNLKYSITDGTNSGSLISNTSGNFSIPLQEGTHTITPILENPTYFNASPSNVIVTFPTQTSPFTQNFCVTANGVRPDLEVTMLPLVPARPGFNAFYKLIYKNKGNTTQSGSVNVNFNDALLDFLSATPTVSAQTLNNLSWVFTNLAPFETREITFTLNVNSPMQTPAVTGGTVLNYLATITSPATDEMPSDNTFAYNQTVVNSFDPNDKTCLEGAIITQAKVGDYVHYMIRFENNGTANAQNIVVKDIIDTAKFDINTIVPVKGSHSFVTNISAGNKVEFIFENIQLPFATGTNQGFVAFKIKTKSTLVNGNSFSNAASIYFDYNFPIVTNTATTTIQTLSRQDFEFSNYFSLYPNPVKEVLTIDIKEQIEIQSINIYNTLGQLVLVMPNAQNTKTVDVSSLNAGNYFIKINSDKGISATQFIKQ